MKYLCVIATILISYGYCSAQYSDILKPQPAELAALYKKNNVSFVNYFQKTKRNTDSLYAIAAVDSSGYILIKREGKSVHYFQYDESNRLQNRLDSIRSFGSLYVYSYSAGYLGNGLLYSMELPTGVSVFRFDNSESQLNENFLPTGAKLFKKNIYKYNKALKLTFEEYRDSIGRPYSDHSYSYNDKGQKISETSNDYFVGNTKNSMVYFYSYNAAGLLTGMQINVIENYGTADDETGVKHNARYNTISESYIYDKNGLMIKKIHSDSKHSSLNYTVVMDYLENGLLQQEETTNKKGEIISTMTYKYEFYAKER